MGFSPREQTVAVVSGYRIEIEPWVNLVPHPMGCIFGVLMDATHEELASVYAKLAVPYQPYPVLAQAGSSPVPALTFIAGAMARAAPDPAHVEPLIESARELGFPAWYVDQIRSFISLG
jgi:hypothetical protein